MIKLNNKEKILLKSDILLIFGAGMLGPLFAVFTERIGGDILDISWAWATYLIVMGILTLIIGKFSDGNKVSKEKLILIGFALNAIFTFSYLLVSTPFHLFFVQAGIGLSAALTWPAWDALYAKYENRRHAGYTWGLVEGLEPIATGIAVIIGGLIVFYFSFQLLFIVMGCVQIVATIYQAMILKK